ncbi:unnamed protein product, partial [Iphiclides podalirius]
MPNPSIFTINIYQLVDQRNFAGAVNATAIAGVSHELRYNCTDFELATAVIFVERWMGERRTLLAAWRLEEGSVKVLLDGGAVCDPTFRDRNVCLTTYSGDAFVPNCHDFIWLSLIIIIAVAPLVLFYARRARLHSLKLRDLALLEQLLEQRKSNSRKFASHLVSRDEFELREELGCGAHGHVRVAVLRRPRQPPLAVAAKMPAEERLQDEADLIREAGVLATLKHKNVVRFLGVCLDGPALFFMEYAFFGDLRNYLRTRRPLAEFAYRSCATNGIPDGHDVAEAIYVSAAALTQLARDATAALDYLSKRRIVHRDVRASNCLIDETRTLKLADFGLARTLSDEEEEYTYQHLRRLPLACMAPESLTHGVFSTASDVWGLGVLMLELVTLGAPPYGEAKPAEIMDRIRAGGHPPLPPAVNTLTHELLTQCWRLCPCERPSAAQLGSFMDIHVAALAPTCCNPLCVI